MLRRTNGEAQDPNVLAELKQMESAIGVDDQGDPHQKTNPHRRVFHMVGSGGNQQVDIPEADADQLIAEGSIVEIF